MSHKLPLTMNRHPAGAWRLPGLLAAGLLLALLLPALPAVAQSEAEKLPRVSLGEVKGTPGSSAMMPLSLKTAPGRPLGSLSLEIEFVSKSLIFQKISRGIAAEFAEAEIQAGVAREQTDDNGLKHVTLRVSASLPDPPPESGLPDGLLAYLIFDILPEAQPFRIRLTPSTIDASDLSSPPRRFSDVGAEPGLVVIESDAAVFDRMAPAVACFFFSH